MPKLLVIVGSYPAGHHIQFSCGIGALTLPSFLTEAVQWSRLGRSKNPLGGHARASCAGGWGGPVSGAIPAPEHY